MSITFLIRENYHTRKLMAFKVPGVSIKQKDIDWFGVRTTKKAMNISIQDRTLSCSYIEICIPIHRGLLVEVIRTPIM